MHLVSLFNASSLLLIMADYSEKPAWVDRFLAGCADFRANFTAELKSSLDRFERNTNRVLKDAFAREIISLGGTKKEADRVCVSTHPTLSSLQVDEAAHEVEKEARAKAIAQRSKESAHTDVHPGHTAVHPGSAGAPKPARPCTSQQPPKSPPPASQASPNPSRSIPASIKGSVENRALISRVT